MAVFLLFYNLSIKPAQLSYHPKTCLQLELTSLLWSFKICEL